MKINILESHFSVSAFDFLVGGIPSDTKDVVRVSPELLRSFMLLRFRSVSRHFRINGRFVHKTLEMPTDTSEKPKFTILKWNFPSFWRNLSGNQLSHSTGTWENPREP